MSLGTLSLGRIPKSAFGLVAVGLALGGVALANTDALLERGFERALARTAGPAEPGARVMAGGSEDFWLRREGADKKIVRATMKPIGPGARITMSVDGVDRVLVVSAVTELPEGFRQALGDSEPTRLVLVTCRDIKGGGPPMRVVLPADGPWPTLAASPPHAL